MSETRREKSGQRMGFAEGTAEEAAAGSGLRKGAVPTWSGAPFRFRRGSAPHFRESGPRKAEKFGIVLQLRARKPKGSAPGVPGYWSPQASRLSGTKSAQAPARDQCKAAHGIPRQD